MDYIDIRPRDINSASDITLEFENIRYHLNSENGEKSFSDIYQLIDAYEDMR